MASHTEASVNIDIKTHWAIAKLFRLIVLRKVWNMGDLLGNDRQSVLSEMTNFDKNRLDFDFLFKFVNSLALAGCQKFIIHARIAILNGLSPKENRTIPPLNYDRVFNLKKEFPNLEIILNGGISNVSHVDFALKKLDGVKT